MICPNCKKETSDSKNFCEHCGNALFGPQSIKLQDLGSSGFTSKDDIAKLTGIDINSISNDTSAYTNLESNSFTSKLNDNIIKPKKVKKEKQEKPEKVKSNKNLDIKLIIIVILIIVIIILGMLLLLKKPKDDDCAPPVSETPKVTYNGYKVTTPSFNFTMPITYAYSQRPNDVVIKNDNLSMVVYNSLADGKVDIVTSATVKEKYDYSDAEVYEYILNNRKLIMVTYSDMGTNYMDFYYQFDGERVLYGQAQSHSKTVLTSSEVRNIIDSFEIRNNNDNLTFSVSGSNFNDILAILK